MTKYKIEFNKEECIGCGSCASVCDNWILDEKEYKAKPKKTILDKIGCNKDAEEACPVGAIKVKEV